MTTIQTGTLPAGPLFEWFDQDRNNRARLRAAGYSDGRITNWKSRGIPRAEVGNIAPFMGMTYEEYVHAAEAWQLQAKKQLRRVAACMSLWLASALLQFQSSDARATISHNSNSSHLDAQVVDVIHIVRLFLLSLHDKLLRGIFHAVRELATVG